MNACTPIDTYFASPADPAEPLRSYVASHFDGLWHAARLLGGYKAAQQVMSLAEALASGASPSRLTRRRIFELLDLLALENVGVPERVDMGFFAIIDPSDPVVEEICLLADGLSDAIGIWQRARERAPV